MWVSVILTVALRGALATLAATPATHARTASLECDSLRPTSPGALARIARLAVVSASNFSLASVTGLSVHGLPAAPRTRSAPTLTPMALSRRACASASVSPDRSTPPAVTPAGAVVGAFWWRLGAAGAAGAGAPAGGGGRRVKGPASGEWTRPGAHS